MPLLKAQKTIVIYQRARVDVPEFGTDENGEPVYVFVRNLTLSEQKQVRARVTWIDRASRQVAFDAVQVAALAAVDGKENDKGLGNRIFPSEKFVGELPPVYEPAIVRISNRILELSGLIVPSERDLATEPTVDDTKKN